MEEETLEDLERLDESIKKILDHKNAKIENIEKLRRDIRRIDDDYSVYQIKRTKLIARLFEARLCNNVGEPLVEAIPEDIQPAPKKDSEKP